MPLFSDKERKINVYKIFFPSFRVIEPETELDFKTHIWLISKMMLKRHSPLDSEGPEAYGRKSEFPSVEVVDDL